jgi:hypothetical protein
MKKMIVLAVVGLFGTQFAKAQVAKGDFLVGGTVGIKSETEKPNDDNDDVKSTTTNFFISPKVGYALSDKWMVGVFAITDFTTVKEETSALDTKSQSNMITPGVFVRNYHMIGGSKFAFFGEANVGYGFGQTKMEGNKVSTQNQLIANIQPGISYFVTKRFVLEGVFGGINYTNFTSKIEATNVKSKTSTFDFQFTKQFALGVSFLF